MTVKEMHIKFGVGFQKLNANSRRKIFPQEVDLLLNREVNRFITDHVKPKPLGLGFEVDQESTDAIRPLIITDYVLDPYLQKQTATSKLYTAELPINYRYLLDESVGLSCTIPATTDKTFKIAAIAIPDTTKSTPAYYQTVQLAIGSTVLASVGALPGWVGLPSKDYKFQLYSLLLEIFIQNKSLGLIPGYSIYWERFNGKYYPNQFVVTYDGGTSITNATLTIDSTAITIPFSTITTQVTIGDTEYLTSAREVKASVVEQLLTTPFYKPSKISPIGLLADNRLKLYVHPSTIVSSVQISYIREPERIDLALSRNCQLAPGIHDIIVSEAVQEAAGTTDNKSLVEFKLRDNALNSPS